MTHFIQVSVIPGSPGGGAVRVNINAIAFYAAWETGSKIEMQGGLEPFIVREVPDGIDRMIRVAVKDQRPVGASQSGLGPKMIASSED